MSTRTAAVNEHIQRLDGLCSSSSKPGRLARGFRSMMPEIPVKGHNRSQRRSRSISMLVTRIYALAPPDLRSRMHAPSPTYPFTHPPEKSRHAGLESLHSVPAVLRDEAVICAEDSVCHHGPAGVGSRRVELFGHDLGWAGHGRAPVPSARAVHVAATVLGAVRADGCSCSYKCWD